MNEIATNENLDGGKNAGQRETESEEDKGEGGGGTREKCERESS